MTNLSADGAGNDRPEQMDGALAGSAAMNLLVGLLISVMGLGHLYGVIVTATGRGYDYDFRLAALLLDAPAQSPSDLWQALPAWQNRRRWAS
jgi:hypothetical protein